jgi:aldehyde dehydrogenase (NAD+)
LREAVEQFFTEQPHSSEDFSGIVNKDAVRRLKSLMEGVSVYYGGEYDEAKRIFSPTILTDVKIESEVMKDEIFGPILPVLGFNELNEVVQYINKGEKPLSVYYFSESKKKQKEFLHHTFSGDAALNDVVMHFTNLSLPFGGVGYSGMGSYHGKRSFDVFSHERSILKTTTILDLPLRYPPYKRSVLKLLKYLFR